MPKKTSVKKTAVPKRVPPKKGKKAGNPLFSLTPTGMAAAASSLEKAAKNLRSLGKGRSGKKK